MMAVNVCSPHDGESLGSYHYDTETDITFKLSQAQAAGRTWAGLTVKDRCNRLAPLTGFILEDLDNLADIIGRTSGKVPVEALLGEIFPVLAQTRHYLRHAQTILGKQRVATSPYSYPDATAIIARHPYGVVAVISPWNYPFQLSMIPLLTALFAGNAVMLKVSEWSLPVAEAIMALLAKLDLPAGLVQWVIGAGEQGEQLIRAHPDMVFFTGSLNTGRKIMVEAAQHPIPVILELGGNDAMIVFADADLERAANAAVYGAFCHSGQVCAAVKRLYVEASCYPDILQNLLDKISQLRLGKTADCELGAINHPQQVERIQAHYDDAIALGAKASGPLNLQGNYLTPILLWDVSADMRVVKEETFGPLLPIMAFESERSAVDFANESAFGLNASIWSRDLTKAERVARLLHVGNWAINDVLKNIGHPALPFGGVGHSGFGRYHGDEGLLSFTYPVSGLTSRNPLPHEPNWFPYSETRFTEFKAYLDFLFGHGSFLARAARNRDSLMAFKEYSGLHLRQHWHNFLALISKNG